MKQFFIYPLCFLLLLGGTFSVSAQNKNTNVTNTKNSVEKSCLTILNKYIKNTPLQDINLESIDVDGAGMVNFTDYENGFLKHIKKNPRNNTTLFLANRNNIGTIIGGGPYLVSQVYDFGDPTAFTFPYAATREERAALPTHSYGDLKQKVLYTHHLKTNDNKKGKFLSCGLLKLTPVGNYSLGDMSPANYMTNFLDSSGFKMPASPEKPEVDNNGNRFIVGLVKVPIKNYQNIHFMNIDIMTVAFDNKSSYLNEFETFPLQVKAMTNEDVKNNVDKAQDEFLKLIQQETCLGIGHKKNSSLPAKCNGTTKSLTSYFRNHVATQTEASVNIGSRFWNAIFPVASAQELDQSTEVASEQEDDYSHLPRGMYFREGFSYENIQKLDQLNDSLLKAHVLKALSEGIEEQMKANVEGDSVEAHDNRVFLQCGMDYATRAKLLNEWVSSIDVNTFSVDNITYPDPKIGDCIIPYPDVRHKDKIIENSFLTNQYNAALHSNNEEKRKELEPILGMDSIKTVEVSDGKHVNSNIIMFVGLALLIGGMALIFVLLRRKK